MRASSCSAAAAISRSDAPPAHCSEYVVPCATPKIACSDGADEDVHATAAATAPTAIPARIRRSRPVMAKLSVEERRPEERQHSAAQHDADEEHQRRGSDELRATRRVIEWTERLDSRELA